MNIGRRRQRRLPQRLGEHVPEHHLSSRNILAQRQSTDPLVLWTPCVTMSRTMRVSRERFPHIDCEFRLGLRIMRRPANTS